MFIYFLLGETICIEQYASFIEPSSTYKWNMQTYGAIRINSIIREPFKHI